MRRSHDAAEELTRHGIRPVVGDVRDPRSLRDLDGPFDWVANTVSSSRGDATVYREVYRDGTRNVLACLADWGCRRYVYSSSTSVYAQQDGSVVTEESPTEPKTETARMLVAAEQELGSAPPGLPVAIGLMRVSGIYGPGRGHLYQQFLRGEARVQGDGSRIINMIHRDDVAGALASFLSAPGLPPGVRVYNATDDAPVTQREFFEWLAGRLGRPFPPPASAAEGTLSKRGQTQKRVSNRRLRTELSWVPRYPTFREGYEALITGSDA